jgi:hypothetical protein
MARTKTIQTPEPERLLKIVFNGAVQATLPEND